MQKKKMEPSHLLSFDASDARIAWQVRALRQPEWPRQHPAALRGALPQHDTRRGDADGRWWRFFRWESVEVLGPAVNDGVAARWWGREQALKRPGVHCAQ